MYIILLFFSFILYLLFYLAQSYEIPSKYRHSLLQPDIHNNNSLQPNEIYIHQFQSFSPNQNQTYKFYFKSNQGQPLFFGYYSDNIETISITPQNIPNYIINGFLILPSKVDSTSKLIIKSPFPNDINSKGQYLLLIYCSGDQQCDYCVSNPSSLKDTFELKENHIISDKKSKEGFYEELSHKYLINLSNDKPLNEDVTITIYTTIYSGLVDYNVVEINNQTIYPVTEVYRNQIIMKLKTKYNSTIIFKPNILEASFYLLHFTINEDKDTIKQLETGFTQIHQIKLYEVQKFIIQNNISKLMMHFKSENCLIEVTDIGEQAVLYTNNDNFYQFTLNDKKGYTFSIKIIKFLDNDNKNTNEICNFYTYGMNIDKSQSIILFEGVTYTTRLTPNEDIIYYEFPFVFDKRANCFVIDFDLISLSTIDIEITMNDQYISAQTKTIGDKYSHFISMDIIRNFCSMFEICKIKIRLSSSAEALVNVRVKAKQQVPYYINKNEVFDDMILPTFSRLYYTDVLQNETGVIKIILKNQGVSLFHKIIEKEYLNLTNIIESDDDWEESFNYLRSESKYQVNADCSKGCYLIIKIESNVTFFSKEKEVIKYGIIVNKKDSIILSPVNHKIIGNFDKDKSQYTFRFNIYNVRKFQIVLGGSAVKYQLINVDLTVPCCDTFNEVYYPEEGSTFVETIIGDDENKKYNITIDVVAISTNSDPYLSFYKITVVPFAYSNVPLYYVSDYSSVDCYTGKDQDKVYILFERGRYEVFTDFIIISSISNELYESYFVNVMYLKYYEYDHLPRINREKYFLSQGNFTEAQKKFRGLDESDQVTIGLFFIITLKNNSKMTFSINQINAFSTIFPIPNERLYFVISETDMSSFTFLPKGSITLSNDYLYKFEIERKGGYGIFQLNDTYNLEGKKTFYLQSEQLKETQLYYIHSDKSYCTGYIQIDPLINIFQPIKMIKENSVSSFEFNLNPFPLYFFMKLNKTMTSLVFTLRLRYEDIENYTLYNFTNLNFEMGYITDDTFNSYKNGTTLLFNTTTPFDISFETQPLVTFQDSNIENFKNFDYVYIKLTEKEKQLINQTFKVEIYAYTNNVDLDIQNLIVNKYHYNRINDTINATQFYSLKTKPSILTVNIEFASCSDDDIYELTFYYIDKVEGKKVWKIFPKESITIFEKDGKTIYSFKKRNDKEMINLNVTLIDNKSNSSSHYHLIKYYLDDNSDYLPMKYNITHEKLTTEYNPITKTITSKWDFLKNSLNNNQTLSSVFYYYLFKRKENATKKYSICLMEQAEYSETTIKNYISHNNNSFSTQGYDNVILAYFTVQDQDYMFLFNTEQVDIYFSKSVVFWSIIIFAFIALIIVFGTYTFYREIQERKKLMLKSKASCQLVTII